MSTDLTREDVAAMHGPVTYRPAGEPIETRLYEVAAIPRRSQTRSSPR